MHVSIVNVKKPCSDLRIEEYLIVIRVKSTRKISEVHDVFTAFQKMTFDSCGYEYDMKHTIKMHFSTRNDIGQLIKRLSWYDDESD